MANLFIPGFWRGGSPDSDLLPKPIEEFFSLVATAWPAQNTGNPILGNSDRFQGSLHLVAQPVFGPGVGRMVRINHQEIAPLADNAPGSLLQGVPTLPASGLKVMAIAGNHGSGLWPG